MTFGKMSLLKSVQIRIFLWPVFSCIRAEYGNLLRKSPYSVRIQENADQEKLHIWTLFMQCVSNPKAIPTCVRFRREVPSLRLF